MQVKDAITAEQHVTL